MYKFDSYIQLYKSDTLLCVMFTCGDGEMMGGEERVSTFSKCLPFQNRVKKMSTLPKGIHISLYIYFITSLYTNLLVSDVLRGCDI